ncbi:hypothetical protein [Nonomuraea sp. NPDC049784]|uniref:hypothetical protein n=1 Tax=Nonomuraea sp. NPDC049784 TaxID=3154361 RepID=UPI0033C820EA
MDDITPEGVPAEDSHLFDEPADWARQEREQQAARLAAWPILHGDIEALDLAPLWARIREADRDLHGLALVEHLAEEGGGVALRLRAGVQSLLARRDGNVRAHVVDIGSAVELTVWSMGGCWRPARAWHLQATLHARGDHYGEVRLAGAGPVQFAVRGENGHTVFTDPEDGPLTAVAARWYLAWEGRRSIRDFLTWPQPDLPGEPLALEAFLQGHDGVADQPYPHDAVG